MCTKHDIRIPPNRLGWRVWGKAAVTNRSTTLRYLGGQCRFYKRKSESMRALPLPSTPTNWGWCHTHVNYLFWNFLINTQCFFKNTIIIKKDTIIDVKIIWFEMLGQFCKACDFLTRIVTIVAKIWNLDKHVVFRL